MSLEGRMQAGREAVRRRFLEAAAEWAWDFCLSEDWKKQRRPADTLTARRRKQRTA